MDLIDEKGRILGVVNIIDALAVLIVLAVVGAGIALVSQPAPKPAGGPPTDVTHVTLDLGKQPAFIANAIEIGDTYSPSTDSKVTITDVYVAPEGAGMRVLLGLELSGQVQEDTIIFDGAPPRLGRKLAIRTKDYEVSGIISSSEVLRTTSTEVLIETTVDAQTAAEIETGDTYSLAGTNLATVKSVHVYGTEKPDVRRVLLGLSLSAVQLDGPHFGNTPVRKGATIPFRTDLYSLTGELRRVGASEPLGEPSTRTVILKIENVDPEFANRIRSGMAETIGGQTIATIEKVSTAPAMMVLTSQDGNVYLREHPVNVDVRLTVDLRVRTTPSGPTFKGRTLQHGKTIVLDLGSITVKATVVSL